jgi:hypothetical protein
MITPDQIEDIAVALETSAALFASASAALEKASRRAFEITKEAKGLFVFSVDAPREVLIAVPVIAAVLRNERDDAIN